LLSSLTSVAVDAAKDGPATPKTLASKLSNLSHGKPATPNLAPLNTKPIKLPQPSAALQSLQSARFLTSLNPLLYLPNVASPNPALKSAVTSKGKSFRYDQGFLLRVQKVFTEKPSMEFESQIKALTGDSDGGSARPDSSRTPQEWDRDRTPPAAIAPFPGLAVLAILLVWVRLCLREPRQLIVSLCLKAPFLDQEILWRRSIVLVELSQILVPWPGIHQAAMEALCLHHGPIRAPPVSALAASATS